MLRAELFNTQLARTMVCGRPNENGLVAEPSSRPDVIDFQCTAMIAVWPKAGHVIWQVE